MPTGSARDKRFRCLRGRVFRTIPDQQNFVARKRCRAGRHDGALRAYPEAIGQDEPRTFLLPAGTALLQAGFQPFSQLAAASHSLQAFPADQYGAGLPKLQSAKRGLVRHHREMSTRPGERVKPPRSVSTLQHPARSRRSPRQAASASAMTGTAWRQPPC